MDLTSLLHWTMLAATLICGASSEGSKRLFFWANKSSTLKTWQDVVVHAIPVLVGLGLGLIPGVPHPDKIHDGISAVLYYTTNGILSAWTYGFLTKTLNTLSDKLPNIIVEWVRKNLGL